MASFNLVFCNRNDNYAQNQNIRIEKFIEYYAALQAGGLDLHVTVVDWNPPPDRPLLQNAFSWPKLRNVTHIVVTPEEHERRFPNSKRKINDYTGRNLAMAATGCDYNVILNQDIFVSPMVFQEIAKFPVGAFFFRGDREDVAEEVILEGRDVYSAPVIKQHGRLLSFPLQYLNSQGRIRFFEFSLRGHFVQRFKRSSLLFRIVTGLALAVVNAVVSPVNRLSVLDFLFLHMNACGDFLVLPAKHKGMVGFFRYPETDDFYMHTDGYILVEMAKAGLRQVILRVPSGIRHIDHSRPDRSTDTPYEIHKQKYIKMLTLKQEGMQCVIF